MLAPITTLTLLLATPSLAQFGVSRGLPGNLSNPRDIACADLDGDGDDDVLCASWGDDRLIWFEALGGVSYAPAADLDADCRDCFRVTVADVDADGDPDVLYAASSPSLIYLLENLGGGVYGTREVVDTFPSVPWDLELADLDGDGDLDLAVLADVHEVRLFENVAGTFTYVTSLTATGYLFRLELGQIGGDELADVAVLYDGGSVKWFRNRSGWSFQPAMSVSVGYGPGDFCLTDLDGDGDLDIVSMNTAGLDWAKNLGNDSFISKIHLADLNYGSGRRLSAADMDNDGDEDLLVSLDDEVLYYENVGGALANDVVVATVGNENSDPWAADLDQDGDLDVVFPSVYTNKVYWTEAQLLPSLGVRACAPGVPNSTGLPGVTFASGSAIPGDDALVLHARDLPAGMVGYFLAGQTPGFVHAPPGSVGNLCLSGVIGRLTGPGQVQTSTLAGTLSVDVGTQSIPQGGGMVTIQPGETWTFQLWHRDLVPQSASNFTSSVGVTFQ